MSQKHDPAHESGDPANHPAHPSAASAGGDVASQPPVTLESWLAAAPQTNSETPKASTEFGFSSEPIPHAPEPISAPPPIAAPQPLRAIVQQAPPTIQVVSIPASAFNSWQTPEPIAESPAPTDTINSASQYESADAPETLSDSDWITEPEAGFESTPTSELEFLDQPAAEDTQPVDGMPTSEPTPLEDQPPADWDAPSQTVAQAESADEPEPHIFDEPSTEPAELPLTQEEDLLAVNSHDVATRPADDLADLFDDIDEISKAPPTTIVSISTPTDEASTEIPIFEEPGVVEPVHSAPEFDESAITESAVDESAVDESMEPEPIDPLAVDFAIGGPTSTSTPEPIAAKLPPIPPATIVDATLPSLAAMPTHSTPDLVIPETVAAPDTLVAPEPIVADETLAIAPQALVASEPTKPELAAIPVEASAAAALPVVAAGALVASAAAPETIQNATATEVFAHAHEEVEARRGILGLGLLTKLSGLAGLLACIGGLLLVLVACAGLTPTNGESIRKINEDFIRWIAVGFASLLALQIGLAVLTKKSMSTLIPSFIAALLVGAIWFTLYFHHEQMAGYDLLPWSIYLIYASLGGLAVAILGGLIEHRRMREDSHVLAAVFVNVLGAVGGTLLLAVAEGWKIFK